MGGPTDEILKVVVTSYNKYIVSTSKDKTLIIWNIQEKIMEARLHKHVACVGILQISSDNRFIVSACRFIITCPSYENDLAIRIWNIQEKILECILYGHTDITLALVLTSDNKYIVSTSRDKSLRVWSLQDKVQITVFHSDISSLDALAVSTDNKYIVSSFCDTALKIWNFEKKKNVATLVGHKRSIESIEITSDNKHIVSISYDKMLIIWNIKERKRNIYLKAYILLVQGY